MQNYRIYFKLVPSNVKLDSPFNESYPLYTNDLNKIIFTSDEYGINNINILDTKTSITTPITNLLTGQDGESASGFGEQAVAYYHTYVFDLKIFYS